MSVGAVGGSQPNYSAANDLDRQANQAELDATNLSNRANEKSGDAEKMGMVNAFMDPLGLNKSAQGVIENKQDQSSSLNDQAETRRSEAADLRAEARDARQAEQAQQLGQVESGQSNPFLN